MDPTIHRRTRAFTDRRALSLPWTIAMLWLSTAASACLLATDTSLDGLPDAIGVEDVGTDGQDADGSGSADTTDAEQDAEPRPEVCSFLGLNRLQGQVCNAESIDSCGTNGVCLEFSPLFGGRCYTSCLPELCGDSPCEAIGTCTPLQYFNPQTGNRDTIRLDSDENGVEDVAIGICTESSISINRPYQACGLGVLRCELQSRCVMVTDLLGICSLPCEFDVTCPSIQDQRGRCESFEWENDGQVQEAQFCVLRCDVDLPQGCPEGFTCADTAYGSMCVPQ